MRRILFVPLLGVFLGLTAAGNPPRERIAINAHWRFTQGDPTGNFSSVLYDVRPAWPKASGMNPPADAYRLRWDDVSYAPGTLKVVTCRNAKKWAADLMKTAGPAARLKLTPDRTRIRADGRDLSFVTVAVTDASGWTVPRANQRIHFELEGPGGIVATDNGDPTNFEPFPAHERAAFNGLCLVIVRAKEGSPGRIRLKAAAEGLSNGDTSIQSSFRAR